MVLVVQVVLADLVVRVILVLVAQLALFLDNLWVLNPLERQLLLQLVHLAHQ